MKNGELGKIYSDGEVIFKEGEKGEMMYVIQSGKVTITKKGVSGDTPIATLKDGEIFGEMSLFDKLPRSAAAIASGEARVLSIDKKKLFSTISRDPTLVFKILETMSQRIRRLDEDMTKLKKNKSSVLKLCLNVEDTCNMILEEAKNIINAENGSVMLLDSSGALSIKSAFGKESDPKVRLAMGEGVAGDVLKSGKAELINNVLMDSRFIHSTAQIKSLLCVPLKFNENVLGVINISNSSGRFFSPEDLNLLNSLSVYASLAVQNARNFSSLNSITDEVLWHATLLNI